MFLLTGPSGVGKTETGLALADLLFGGEQALLTINLSEYQEAHTVSQLKGSPPGYVGYGQGRVLTEAVRRRPYSVILLDEAEKAHRDVLNLFYQAFDRGFMRDGEGREIDFRNTLFLLTSNLGSELLLEQDAEPEREAWLDALRPLLLAHFQAPLLARMQVVPYGLLSTSALAEIAQLKLTALAAHLKASQGMVLEAGRTARGCWPAPAVGATTARAAWTIWCGSSCCRRWRRSVCNGGWSTAGCRRESRWRPGTAVSWRWHCLEGGPKVLA